MNSMSWRLLAFSGALLVTSLGLWVSLIGISEVKALTAYSANIAFSPWVVFEASFLFITLPFSAMFMLMVFRGRPLSRNLGEHLLCITYFLTAGAVIWVVMFNIDYTNSLSTRGYVECSDTSYRWLPGVDAQYARAPSLCSRASKLQGAPEDDPSSELTSMRPGETPGNSG